MLWDTFSYFLIKAEFRSPLGRNREGMWVPTRSYSIEKLSYGSVSISCTRDFRSDPGKRVCFAQKSEQQISWNPENHSP